MSRLIVTARFRSDVDSILHYLEDVAGPRSADHYARRFRVTIDRLVQFPAEWRATSDARPRCAGRRVSYTSGGKSRGSSFAANDDRIYGRPKKRNASQLLIYSNRMLTLP